jgi:hypothetical protein
MHRVQPRSFGFALAVFLGAWHTLWAFLVWAGAAQWLLDFVFRLHMITPPYRVTAFSPFTATGLVLITAATLAGVGGRCPVHFSLSMSLKREYTRSR